MTNMSQTPVNHVIVVGGGLAGLVATHTLLESSESVTVTLIDKESSLGGNSAKATSGMNAAVNETDFPVFEKDTLDAGHRVNDETLVQTLVHESPLALKWLQETFNVDLSLEARTHRFPLRPDGKPTPVGWTLISQLRASLQNHPRVIVKTLTRLTGILTENDVVTGIRVKSEESNHETELFALAVLLTTGGYAHDTQSADSLLAKVPEWQRSLPTTNGAFATGDGVKIAVRDVHAAVRDLESVQVHPTGLVSLADPLASVKWLAPEALRAHGAILVDAKGTRFVNELAPRDHVTDKIMALNDNFYPRDSTQKVAILILDANGAKAFGEGTLSFYCAKQQMKRFETVAEITAFMESIFGTAPLELETSLSSLSREYFYLAMITPSIHYSHGGLRVNVHGEVLRDAVDHAVVLSPTDERVSRYVPVVGLYAAGEVTGGVHGHNRLAGNSLLECVVFGRRAAKRASASLRTDSESVFSFETEAPLALRESFSVGGNVMLFRFDLPSSRSVSHLQVGDYVAVRTIPKQEGESSITRYYSPISRPDDRGHLDLLLKIDASAGAMCQHFSCLQPGEQVLFKACHVDLGLGDLAHAEAKLPFSEIALICGGTGIAAMLQIIRTLIHSQRQDVQVKLLYAAQTPDDLVFKDRLLSLCQTHSWLHVFLIVEHPDANWEGAVGLLNKTVLQQELSSVDTTKAVLCGPPGMCRALKPLLEEMHYRYFSYM